MNLDSYIVMELIIINVIFIYLLNVFLKISRLQRLLDKNICKKYEYIKSRGDRRFDNMLIKILKKRFIQDRANFEKEKEFHAYVLVQYITPLLLFIIILLKLGKDSFPIILLAFFYYISNRIKFIKMKKSKHLSFQKNTYKIYKFIHNQVSSGVRPYDCIMGLYDVIDDKSFKRTLINMSAVYSQTTDIDLALEEVMDVYPGIDSIMLCSAIKQGVNIGNNMETVERQEKLAFNKYFVYIKNETEKIRIKGFLSISLFSFIIILLVSIPLLYEMKEATSKIFIH